MASDLLNIVMYIVYLPIIILIHELGHAVFVVLVGGKVKEVSIGRGEEAFRFHFHSIQSVPALFDLSNDGLTKGIGFFFLIMFLGKISSLLHLHSVVGKALNPCLSNHALLISGSRYKSWCTS